MGQTDPVTHSTDTRELHPKRILHRLNKIWKSRKGVIEPYQSSSTSQVVLVTEKYGSTRFSMDYIINDVICKKAYPLARIDDTLDVLRGSHYFSALDLYSRDCYGRYTPPPPRFF